MTDKRLSSRLGVTMADVKVSADKHTREKLRIDKDTVYKSEAQRIWHHTKDSIVSR